MNKWQYTLVFKDYLLADAASKNTKIVRGLRKVIVTLLCFSSLQTVALADVCMPAETIVDTTKTTLTGMISYCESLGHDEALAELYAGAVKLCDQQAKTARQHLLFNNRLYIKKCQELGCVPHYTFKPKNISCAADAYGVANWRIENWYGGVVLVSFD
jgi:hypothetical protein